MDKKLVVLIVDDSVEDRVACRRYLRQDPDWRYEVLETTNASGALEICRDTRPDCILLDYRLPDMDGLEVLTSLAGNSAGKALPVVMLTGADEVSLAVEAMRRGAQDFINKNRLTPIDLQRAVRNAIDRVALDRAVKEKELRFRTLTDAMPQLVWTSTGDGRLDYLSSRWAEFTGQPVDRDLSDWWSQVLHADDAAAHQARWREVVASGTDYECEFRLRRADGVYRWHLARALPSVDIDGRTSAWFGTCTDIEERKQAERERERMLAREYELREQAENANRLKDEFLAVVSHELRTPIHAVLGWAKLLQGGKLNGQETLRATEAVLQNARTQAQLITDLLDISGIASGKLRLELRPVDLQSVVEAAIDVMQPAALAKDIEVVSFLGPLHSFVSGDATRVQQAVSNLLSNAVKFTPRGGLIAVRLSQHASEAEISISDSGKGISADFLPYVFDRFRQQDASSTRAYGGLGLGLSIVKYVVEMHGGSVDAFSEGIERGSVFTIRLPLNDMGEQRRLSAIVENGNRLEPEEQLVGVRILVIDDDEHAREMISAVLLDAGATVTTVASVGDAMEKVREEDFTVLVSDIAMPDEDGYVFLRQARALGIRTPALALTAYGSDSDKARALSAGFQAHLSKPVEPHEIVSTLARLAGLKGVEIQQST